MGAIGGDIKEITYNHPTIGSGVIYPKSAEDSTIDFGGLRSNDEANMIDGSGRMIDQMNRVRWSFETKVAWDNNVALELDVLCRLAASPVQTDFTFEHISGTVWGATGKPVGDLQGEGNNAVFGLKLSGGGEMKKIV